MRPAAAAVIGLLALGGSSLAPALVWSAPSATLAHHGPVATAPRGVARAAIAVSPSRRTQAAHAGVRPQPTARFVAAAPALKPPAAQIRTRSRAATAATLGGPAGYDPKKAAEIGGSVMRHKP
jgi:hypothetical protein